MEDPEQNYIRVLQDAHKRLLPDRNFSYDFVNECNMIRNAIKNLVRSDRDDKYAILLGLATDADLKIVNPDDTLRNISTAVANYYTDTCLSINPQTAARLAILWGLGGRMQAPFYREACLSIPRKMKAVYGTNWNIPSHVITMLFDPEIGLLTSLTENQRTRPYEHFDFGLEVEEIEKHLANDIIIWKISNIDQLEKIYNNYLRQTPGLEKYVTLGPLTQTEADLFIRYHHYRNGENGEELRYTPESIRDSVNESFEMMEEDPRVNIKPEDYLTQGEAQFVLDTYHKFIRGEYPIDMRWDTLCKQL